MLLGLTYQLIRFLTDLVLVRTRSDAQLRAEVLALRHQLPGVLVDDLPPARLAAMRRRRNAAHTCSMDAARRCWARCPPCRAAR